MADYLRALKALRVLSEHVSAVGVVSAQVKFAAAVTAAVLGGLITAPAALAAEPKVITEVNTANAVLSPSNSSAAQTGFAQRELESKRAANTTERARVAITPKSDGSEVTRIHEGHRKLRPTASDVAEQPATF
jgi:hypothetical protein